MVFSGIPFIFFFLTITLIAYFAVPYKFKNHILLITSLIFYAWGEPVYILLMLFSTFVSWICGVGLLKNPGHNKLYLLISVVINLALLGFFKYAPLFVSTANGIFDINIPIPHITLPIGISFYTFQTMSYNIDVYRGDVKPEKNFFTLMTYISMFPQLIAGPIVRYETVQAEMRQRTLSFEKFSDGTVCFLHGLYKKVLLANTIGELFDEITALPAASQSILTLWLGIIAFYFHIYFDFSGYSDMAIGMGKMLGFTFPKNFNYPMIASSVSDFWRRWHMSLTTWFKDYVYIPLGGSRCSRIINIRNLLIVWLLTGFWHGASWNFVVWGLYFGIILIIEKHLLKGFFDKKAKFIGHIYTTLLVTVGWAIFSLEDFSVMTQYIKHMFINERFIDQTFLYYAIPYLPILAIALIFALPTYPMFKTKLAKITSKPILCVISTLSVISSTALTVLSVAMLVGNDYNPFLYFRF